MPRCRILAGSSSTIRMRAYGSRRFAAPTCTAVAPAIIISMTSSAHDTPPQPITGRGACARHLIYHTQRYRKYRIARETAHFVGYHRPPAHRVDAHAEHRIYQAYSVGTGILACAGYRHYMSPTLGLSFMNTGGGHALYGTCHGCRRCGRRAEAHAAVVNVGTRDIYLDYLHLFFMVYLGATLLVFVDREAADIGYYRLVEQSSERRQLLAYDGIDSRILQILRIYHAAPALGYARRRIAETRLARSTP